MPEEEKDLYRDTLVRYLGYANEVGESFRAFIGHKWVMATYGVATVYVLADTRDKSLKEYTKSKNDANVNTKVAFTTADTLAWQMLASVMIPGFTINRICALSEYVFKVTNVIPKGPRKWAVTSIGLCTIPFIIHPIDRLCDKLLDGTLRKYKPS